MAVIDSGTDWTSSARFCAVTITSSSAGRDRLGADSCADAGGIVSITAEQSVVTAMPETVWADICSRSERNIRKEACRIIISIIRSNDRSCRCANIFGLGLQSVDVMHGG